MDEQEKPFDAVSIVILVLISLANDAAEVFFDILTATVVGLPGEAIMEPINFFVDCIVTPWFFIKCGFGGPALAQILDDLLSLVGIPGRTICVVFGIYVANNPNSLFGKIGQTAATIETGGEAGALKAGEKTAQEAEKAGGAAAKAREKIPTTSVQTETERAQKETGGPRTGKETNTGEGENEAGKEERAKKEGLEKEMESGAEISPEETAQKEIFEKIPQITKQEGGEADTREKPSNTVSIEEGRNFQKAEEVKENLEHPNAPHDITGENRGDRSRPSNVIDIQKPQENDGVENAA
jgi:hypothetical protein